MLRPGTLKSVLYTSQWIINSHIFKAELFLYVSYEAKHYGMLSLDVVIVRAGILKAGLATNGTLYASFSLMCFHVGLFCPLISE